MNDQWWTTRDIVLHVVGWAALGVWGVYLNAVLGVLILCLGYLTITLDPRNPYTH